MENNTSKSDYKLISAAEIDLPDEPEQTPGVQEPEVPVHTESRRGQIQRVARNLSLFRRSELADKEIQARDRTSKRMIRYLANIAVSFAVRNKSPKEDKDYQLRNAEQIYLQKLWNRYTRRELGLYR